MQNSSPSTVTIVRIWHSSTRLGDKAPYVIKNNELVRVESVGHVSIEIKSGLEQLAYFSLWPCKVPKFFLKTVDAVKLQNPMKDEYAEDRQADSEIMLYSLNTQAMLSAGQAMMKQIKYWSLPGRNIFFDEANSCSGLAYAILCAGGIKGVIANLAKIPSAMSDSELAYIRSESFIVSLAGILQLEKKANTGTSIITNKTPKVNLKANKDPMRENIVTTPDSICDLVKAAKNAELDFYKITSSDDLTCWHENHAQPGILSSVNKFVLGSIASLASFMLFNCKKGASRAEDKAIEQRVDYSNVVQNSSDCTAYRD